MRITAHSPRQGSRRALGTVALATAGALTIGLLSACTPPNEKDAAQAPAVTSMPAGSIEPVTQKTEGTTTPYSKSDGGVTITVHDLLKPDNEIMVSAQCGTADTRATLSSSLTSKKVTMSPAADRGELVGFVTVPANIGPGPRDGYHTVTVRCASGKTGTITLNSAGNGDHPHHH